MAEQSTLLTIVGVGGLLLLLTRAQSATAITPANIS